MAINTIDELLAEIGEPDHPCPPAPAWHVDTDACQHGWITDIPPRWILCDCEDPANPWPVRDPSDGPIDCSCYGCLDHEPRWERGKLNNCEYKDHHCEWCHNDNLCTTAECLWKWKT